MTGDALYTVDTPSFIIFDVCLVKYYHQKSQRYFRKAVRGPYRLLCLWVAKNLFGLMTQILLLLLSIISAQEVIVIYIHHQDVHWTITLIIVK